MAHACSLSTQGSWDRKMITSQKLPGLQVDSISKSKQETKQQQEKPKNSESILKASFFHEVKQYNNSGPALKRTCNSRPEWPTLVSNNNPISHIGVFYHFLKK